MKGKKKQSKSNDGQKKTTKTGKVYVRATFFFNLSCFVDVVVVVIVVAHYKYIMLPFVGKMLWDLTHKGKDIDKIVQYQEKLFPVEVYESSESFCANVKQTRTPVYFTYGQRRFRKRVDNDTSLHKNTWIKSERCVHDMVFYHHSL